MSEFVRSAVVYRSLRAALGPALQEAGYRRVPKTQAAWHREAAGGELSLSFQVSSYGGAALGGNTLDASVIVRTSDRKTGAAHGALTLPRPGGT
jgi:hypothetical protein